jgi:hypothetical protein
MAGNTEQEREKVARKLRALGITYRILLVAGLVLFVVTAVLAILIVRVTAWYLAIPAVIFLAGLVLARVEYNLFRRS